MEAKELKEKIFYLVTYPPCHECEFWDSQARYCFSRDTHEAATRCRLLDQILALVDNYYKNLSNEKP